MRSSLWRLLAVLMLTVLGAAACGDNPAGTPGARDEAQLGFSLNLQGTGITTLVIEVTAPDITSRLVFNVPVQNGVAAGTIAVPAGNARLLSVKAYDAEATLTHEGSRTIDVKPGNNPAIALTLVPRPGHLPISVSFGSLVIVIHNSLPSAGLAVGAAHTLSATVTDPSGNVVGGQVAWATLNPAVATVDSAGRITARAVGSTEIVATHGGYGASLALNVVTAAPPAADVTMPTLVSFTVAKTTYDVSAGDTAVTFTVQATDTLSGMRRVEVELYSPGETEIRSCSASVPSPVGSHSPVTFTCTVPFTRWSTPGSWKVQWLVLRDAAGNRRTMRPAEIPGLPGYIQIVNPTPDAEAPALTALTVSQDTVSRSGSAGVSFTLTFDETGSGVREGTLDLYNPAAGMGTSCYMLATGDPSVWTCHVIPESWWGVGDWKVNVVSIADNAGNTRNYFDQEIADAGFATKLVVTP